MKVTLDQKTIQMIDLFRTLTGSDVVDCIAEEDALYFIVAEGQYGLAVGKNGVKIKNAERVFKKQIRVFEYSPDMESFIRNVIPGVQEISKSDDGKVYVKVKPSEKARSIGKSGKNIKLLSKVMQRLFEIEEIKVK